MALVDTQPPEDFKPTDVHVHPAAPRPDVEPVPTHVRLERLEEGIRNAELRVDRMRLLTERLAQGPARAHASAQRSLAYSLALLHELVQMRAASQRQHYASIRRELAVDADRAPGALAVVRPQTALSNGKQTAREPGVDGGPPAHQEVG